MELPDYSQYTLPASAPAAPKILVLLAAYNGEAWIGEQIQSILRQKHVEVRLIVRDDESSDSTGEVVGRLSGMDPRIELLPGRSRSGSASQNFFALIRSCEASGFDFVALSDQDDVWHPDKLRQAVDCLTRSHSSGYSSAVTAVWPSGKSRILRQNESITESDFLFEGAGQGCSFVLAKSFYDRLRTFCVAHERLTCDAHFHDWTIYALARTWKLEWTFNAHSTMDYRQHGQNDTGARSSLKGVIMRLTRIREGWYSEQLLRISAICHAASKNETVIAQWDEVLRARKNWHRRADIVRFCMRGGRRRHLDNVILIFSGIIGWL